MSIKEISHFVRNDGLSPSEGGWKSGGAAATFPPTDDTERVSFRPQEEISYSIHVIRQLSDPTYAIFKWLGLEMTDKMGVCIVALRATQTYTTSLSFRGTCSETSEKLQQKIS